MKQNFNNQASARDFAEFLDRVQPTEIERILFSDYGTAEVTFQIAEEDY